MLVVGNVLATLADIVVPLVVVRLAVKDQVASLAGLMLVYNTLALLLLGGFHQTVTFFLPGRAREERRAIAEKIARVLRALGGVGALALVGIGAVGSDVLEAVGWVDGGEATDLRPLMFLALFPVGDLPGRILPNLMVVERRPRWAAAYGVLRSLGISVATLIPFAMGADVAVVAAALSGFAAVQLGFVAWVFRRCYRGCPSVASPVSLRALVRFGVPLGATDMVSALNSRFDRLLILTHFPASFNAIYHAGAWQIPVVTRLPYLVATALAPSMVEAFKAGRASEALQMWRESIGKVSLLVVPITSVFFVGAEEFIELAFTAEYLGAVGVFRWYTLLSVVRVAAFGTVIVAAGRPGYVLQSALFTFASNVVLSVPLLWLVGFEGPAMGTALAFVPMAVFYCSRIARAAGVSLRQVFPLRRYVRVLLVAAVGVALAWVFKTSSAASPALRLLGVALIVLGSFAVLGTLSRTVTRADWAFVRGRLRRRG